MSTALPSDPLAAWLLQQAPVVVVLIVLTLALWRRDVDRDRLIGANTEHISQLATDIDRVVDQTGKLAALVVAAAALSVATVSTVILYANRKAVAQPRAWRPTKH